jgi:hypothetical protein
MAAQNASRLAKKKGTAGTESSTKFVAKLAAVLKAKSTVVWTVNTHLYAFLYYRELFFPTA